MDGLKGTFEVLEELELLDFFGASAIERDLDDGYWCYEIADTSGVALRFSFRLYERSVQTELRIGGAVVASVSHEGALRMHRQGPTLRCDFLIDGAKTTLSLLLEDRVRLQWATLRT